MGVRVFFYHYYYDYYAQDGFNVKLLFRRLATALPSLDGPPAAADPQASPFAAVLSPAGDDSRARVET